MNKYKISFFSDAFFVFTATFFLSVSILRYNRFNVISTLLVSALTGIAAASGVVIYGLIKSEDYKRAEDRKEKAESLMRELCFLSDDKTLKLLKKCYEKSGKTVEQKDNFIIIKEDKQAVFPLFSLEKTPAKEVIKAYKLTPETYTTVIMSGGVTSETENFLNAMKLRIKVLNIFNVYDMLLSADMLPERVLIPKIKPKKRGEVIKKIFSREKSPKFLLAGTVILLSSVFSYYPVYYIIFGAVLLAIAAALRFFAAEKNAGEK